MIDPFSHCHTQTEQMTGMKMQRKINQKISWIMQAFFRLWRTSSRSLWPQLEQEFMRE